MQITETIEKKAAQLFSVIFHPLLIPTYFLTILLNTQSYISFYIPFISKIKLIAFIFTSTFLIPLMLIYFVIFKANGLIQSLKMENRKERTYPFVLTALLFYMIYYFLKQNNIPVINILASFIWVSTLIIVVALLINLVWKISIHMLGIGGLIGVWFVLNSKLFLNLYILIPILLLCAGLTGYARLKLNAHKPSEVYVGFILGFSIMFSLFYFILKI